MQGLVNLDHDGAVTTGPPRIAVHGGVFAPGKDMGYREPIYLNDAAALPATVTKVWGLLVSRIMTAIALNGLVARGFRNVACRCIGDS